MKYRLRPLECGGYVLEKNYPLLIGFSGNMNPTYIDNWLMVSSKIYNTQEEAQEVINNLERPVIYIDTKGNK